MNRTHLAEQSIFPSNPNLDLEHILSRTETIKDRPIFIHLGGPSAAGKTTLSNMIAAELPNASIFPIDSYLVERLWDPSKVFNHEAPDPNRPYIGGIDPKIWDLDLIEEHLTTLRENEPVSMPVFDQTIKDRVGYFDFEPQKFILVEGGHALSDRFIGNADYSIVVNASLHDRVTRKIIRTHAVYGRDDIGEILTRYVTKDEPVWRVYQAEHRTLADQVIENSADPARDYHDFPGTSAPLPVGKFMPFIPRAGTGFAKPEELFGIVRTGTCNIHMIYAVGEKCMVNLPVSADVLKLLEEFYEIGDEVAA